MISGKVNNVTVVTEVILHAPGMTNVVAVGLGTLSQETVSFCQIKHAGWFFFTWTYSVDYWGEKNRKDTTWETSSGKAGPSKEWQPVRSSQEANLRSRTIRKDLPVGRIHTQCTAQSLQSLTFLNSMYSVHVVHESRRSPLLFYSFCVSDFCWLHDRPKIRAFWISLKLFFFLFFCFCFFNKRQSK